MGSGVWRTDKTTKALVTVFAGVSPGVLTRLEGFLGRDRSKTVDQDARIAVLNAVTAALKIKKVPTPLPPDYPGYTWNSQGWGFQGDDPGFQGDDPASQREAIAYDQHMKHGTPMPTPTAT